MRKTLFFIEMTEQTPESITINSVYIVFLTQMFEIATMKATSDAPLLNLF